MTLPLRDALIPKLRAEFPSMSMRIGGEGEALVVFPAKHAQVGDLTIQDEGYELTVIIGAITHRHFGSPLTRANPHEQAEDIAAQVTEYLGQLFADEIEFYGYGTGGGARARSGTRRGLLSRLFLGWRTYVWSGPLDDA